jgi:hypothetical protein
MSSDGIPPRAGFPAQQVTTPLQHATDAMTPGTAGPKFQIGNAGQVADTVTAPVTIHQILHGNADLGIGRGEFSEPGVHDSQPSHPSQGESR